MRSTTVLSAVRMFALLLVFGGLVSACKKKVEPPPPPPPPPVQVMLQVTSISPGIVPPQTPTSAKIYGSAFEAGAQVSFVGGGEATEVQALDGNTLSVRVPALAKGTYDVQITNPTGESSVLRQGLTVKTLELSCKQATVNFSFDDSGLSSASRSRLDGHMSCYQSEAGPIRVEGHADERGTVDYNLALGQRRAESVKQHLTRGGVTGSRVSTTSYGEERPVASGHDEAAWSQNRRAEISASE